MRAAVIGAGSWGTAYAKVLVDAGNEVTLWARREEVAERIRRDHINADYLPDIELPEALRATHDAAAAFEQAELVAFALPSQTFRTNLAGWVGLLPEDATLMSLMKGVELGTTKRMTEVIAEVTGAAAERIAVVSGPNLALEIAQRQPTATVIACVDSARAATVQQASTAAYFRPYTNTDVIGCELGGAVKNVIALACGMAQGMGFGDNTVASLITRGLAETARLGVALGAGWAIWWRRAHPGSRATAGSASGWGAARAWTRPVRRRTGRWRRASNRAAPYWNWPTGAASRCPSPRPSRRSASEG
jgi:glycerol-3-phosphate dehydrogenase (NAD(P)+)